MKRRITFLLAALLLLSGGLTWAQTRDEVVAYTLDGSIPGGTNAYASESEITQNNITWMVTANTDISPWRFGGKSLDGVDRPMYSINPIADDITKVVITNGTATITVNSMTLIVSSNADFSEPISTITGEWEASSTTTFERPVGADWTNKYFKLVYNVTNTTNSNKYAQFVKGEFYMEMDASAPYIVAEDVEITYDATSGAIEYTVNNPADGTLTSNSTSEWLTLGTVATTIPFTCTANQTTMPRSATVTLTYTYNTDQTVTKNVTVTQAANPDAVNNISDITAAGTYTVQGTIVAKSTRGFIVGDGTGYIYYYNVNYSPDDYNIGDIVKLSGSVVVYGGVYEFNNSTTITFAETSNYVAEDPTIITGEQMDDRVASTTPPQLSSYVQYEGTLSINSTHYNITNITGASTALGSISYPLNVDEITALDGKHVKVTGYYVGISTSTYYNTMLGSIEEISSSDPFITAEDVNIEYNATTGAIAYTINNPVSGGVLTAATESDWLTLGAVGSTVPFTCDANTFSSPRTAIVTLTYTYNTDQFVTKNVTVTQAGNPNVVNNISDITAAGEYTVQGTIVAISNRGFILGDGTGYIYYYYGSSGFEPDDYAIGDMVRLFGSVVSYGGVYEFNNSTTITYVDESNYVAEDPTVLSGADMDARVASTTPAQTSSYVQYEGTLSVNGNYFNIINITGATTAMGSISYPLNVEEISVLDGKQVKVTGYYVGVSSSTYYNTMIGNIVENTEPAILLDNYEIEVPANGGEGYINVTYQNIDVIEAEEINVEFFDESGENNVEYDWITAEIDENNNVYYVVESNQGEARTAYFKVIYYDDGFIIDDDDLKQGGEGSWAGGDSYYSNLVTVNQAAYVPIPTGGDYVRINALDQLTDGGIVVIAARYDSIATNYFAMKNIISQKIEGTEFVSQTSGNNQILPGAIVNGINEYYWVVGINNGVYTFTNANGDKIGYGSGTNFIANGEKTTWNIAIDTSGTALVPNYIGYVITNTTTTNRGIALRDNDGNKGFGAYSTTNLNGNEYNFFLDFFVQTAGTETVTQTTTLNEGWNWWSTYVEQEGINGLQMLQEGLGGNGIAIRSQASGYTDYYGEEYGWWGSLTSINNESSYRVITNAPCSVTMTGDAAVPSQHPITLGQGWTWIGYVSSTAMGVNEALSGLEATAGDKLKSQQGYSDYYGEDYGWYGSLNTIEPGTGLMYYSTNGQTLTFTYPDSNRGGTQKANMTAENNHWKPNTFAYPDNMTVMAVVELDDMELSSDNYELAAFAANGECRGSIKLTYAEPLNRHVAFLTISGKDAAELSFRLYDTETGMEYYDAEESLSFVANAIVGDATDLYVIHFRGMAGMDELAKSVQVYPNPVNRGERFSINMNTESKAPIQVEIINTLGVETLRAMSEQTPASIIAPTVAGVYTLRITVEGKGTIVHKLVVK